jgi:hypothetical protein
MTRRRIARVVLAAAGLGLLGLPACGGPGAPTSTPEANGNEANGNETAAAAAAADPAARYATEPMPLLERTTPGRPGRLYTLDQREALAAVSQHGMRLEPGRAAGFLPRNPFAGSTPMYRLKPSAAATSWLFTASAAERDALRARGWVDEGTAGHLYREAGAGRVRLLRFTNGREWRLATEDRSAALRQQGYTVDGPLGYVHARWIRAGAVYFGMFSEGGHQTIINNSLEEYGRPDWWGGVRDFRDGHPNGSETWPGEDFSYLEPSIGYYDDSEPETLERHIVQATSSGLSFFNFYWYWNSREGRETVTRPALDAFLQARNRDAIDFTVALCAHPGGALTVPVADHGRVADILVDDFLALDNTLRTNDGRKIVTICDARGIGDGTPRQIAGFVDAVRTRARARLGEEVYVMINQAGFDPRQVPQAGADGAYCTTDGPAITRGTYAGYLAGQRAFYAQAPAGYGRCVLSDFDERPRYPIEQPNPGAIRWLPDHTIEGFRRAVRNARDDIDASTRPPTVDNLVFVYAWNEWHEGGVIEPNARDGCAYLDVMRSELALTRGPGCVEAPS